MTATYEVKDLNSIARIYPNVDSDLVKKMVTDYNRMHEQQLPNDEFSDDLDQLDGEIKNVLYDVFVSQSLQSKFALKYRFMQYLDYSSTWEQFFVPQENVMVGDFQVDFFLRDKNSDDLYWVFITEIITEKYLQQIRRECENVPEIPADNIPSRIVFLAAKSYRDVGIDEPIILQGTAKRYGKVPIDVWIEDKEINRPFNDEDLLIVNNLELAAFNFSSLNDVLDAVKSTFGKGQYEIVRIPNFFSKFARKGSQEKETIWKGILLPKELFT
jgi:hypothetical protein